MKRAIFFMLLIFNLCGLSMAILSEVETSENFVDTKEYALKILNDSNDAIMTVQAGEIASKNIRIKNIGKSPINVKKVFLKSCGCASGIITPLFLQSGQEGNVELKLDTMGSQGGIKKIQLVVQTNEGDIVRVDGEDCYSVKSDISLSQRLIDIGQVTSNESFERYVEVIVSSSDVPKRVIALADSIEVNTNVSAGTENKHALSANGTLPTIYSIRIQGNTPTTSGKFQNKIKVVLQDYQNRDRIFEITITGNVQTGVDYQPNQLFLGYITPKKVFDRVVDFSYPEKGVFDIEAVAGPDWLQVSYNAEIKSDGAAQLVLKMTVGDVPYESAGTVMLKITGRFNNKNFVKNIPCMYVSAENNNEH